MMVRAFLGGALLFPLLEGLASFLVGRSDTENGAVASVAMTRSIRFLLSSPLLPLTSVLIVSDKLVADEKV